MTTKYSILKKLGKGYGGNTCTCDPPIIDVDQLPSATGYWKGTTVPNSGYVEKVYFNTNLSVEEVEILFNQLTFKEEDNGSIVLLIDNAESIGIVIVKQESVAAIMTISESVIWANEGAATLFNISEGWQISNNPIAINLDVINEMENVQIGTQNELINSLFSITPFEYVEPNIDKSNLYRTPDNKLYQIITVQKETDEWEGTTVPNSGYVESVYLNTELSVDEVVELVSKLEFVVNDSDEIYMPVLTHDGALGIGILKMNVNEETHYLIADMSITNAYFVSTSMEGLTAGWQISNNPIAINLDVINEMENVQIGTQNDLISSLVSITPFTKKTEEALDFKEVGSGSSGGGIIDVESLPTENIDSKSIYRLSNYKAEMLLTEALVQASPTMASVFAEVIYVKELPEDSEALGVLAENGMRLYYDKSQDDCYVHISEEEVEEVGMDSGWYDLSTFMTALQMPFIYKGAIYSESKANFETMYDCYVLISETIKYYIYDMEWVELINSRNVSDYIPEEKHLYIETLDVASIDGTDEYQSFNFTLKHYVNSTNHNELGQYYDGILPTFNGSLFVKGSYINLDGEEIEICYISNRVHSNGVGYVSFTDFNGNSFEMFGKTITHSGFTQLI